MSQLDRQDTTIIQSSIVISPVKRDLRFAANGFAGLGFGNSKIGRYIDLTLHLDFQIGSIKRPPERTSQHPINDQWRICFKWKDGDAYDVEIADYH